MSAINPASNPYITIGLTCFNAARTIERALRSALAQDWPNFEVLVVDDASMDHSRQLIDRIAKTDNRVKVFCKNVNEGVASARNTILENALGEFIVFFDDDDESLSYRLRIQYEALCAYESLHKDRLVVCYASGIRRYPNGYEMNISAIGSRSSVPIGELVADYLLFNCRKEGVFYGAGTPTCALMARRSVFAKVGGFDKSLRRVEDVDFAIRLALFGAHFIGVQEPLYIQYFTSSDDKTPEKNLDAELFIIEKNSSYLKSKKRYTYARKWFKIRYYHFKKDRLTFFVALFLFLARFPFSGMRHLLRSAPKRLKHEKQMHAKNPTL